MIQPSLLIATGVQYSVRQFIDMVAKELGITLAFEGQGVDEKAVVQKVEGDKALANGHHRVGDVTSSGYRTSADLTRWVGAALQI